jgi:hypothetical protein
VLGNVHRKERRRITFKAPLPTIPGFYLTRAIQGSLSR